MRYAHRELQASERTSAPRIFGLLFLAVFIVISVPWVLAGG
jgi:hypothetical protein